MTYQGVVKNGKIELQPPAELPEGTHVRVEPEAEDWIERIKKLADDIAKATPPGVSIAQEFIKSRR